VGAPIGAVWASKAGDFQPSNFASTQTGIQAALDYCSGGGEVYIGPGTYTGITNLLIYANTQLRGSGMNKTILQRDAAATGTTLRERSTAEGNPGGGTGIFVRDIRFDGNGSVGDGINLGNQVPGVQLNFNAGVQNVHVRSFASGTGMRLRCNAVQNFYIWVNLCNAGLITEGGSSSYVGVWAEGNTGLDIDVQSSNDSFLGIHCEGSNGPSDPFISVSGNNNFFYGISISLQQNRTNVILLKTGFSRNCFFGVVLTINTFTYTNLIYVEAWARGTGSSLFEIPMWIDNGTQTSYVYDSSANAIATWSGANLTGNNIQAAGTLGATGATTLSTLHTTGASQLDGSVTTGVAGASALFQVGQGAADSFFSTMRVRSGSTGGAEAAVFLNQNNVDKAKFFYNGTATFLDATSGLRIRDAVGGTERARIDSTGVLVAGSVISNVCPTLPDNTTPSVSNVNACKCSPAGATTITNFTNGQTGQIIYIIFTNANATLSDAGNLKLNGGFTSSGDDTMQLIYDGTNWYELARSVN
jgi:hypothetical protein